MEKVTGSPNPAILKWARESAGISISEAAHSLKKEPSEIANWENGNSVPTYTQLEKLAYKLYKRPLVLFFLPDPPQEHDLKKSFRTIPLKELENLSPDTRYAIRFAMAMQISISELSEEAILGEKKIFRDISLKPSADLIDAAFRVRQYLGISLKKQFSWRRIDEALQAWRNAVESNGLFVFKRSFKQREISGFCIHDSNYPIIYLNNFTSKSRQIFTLFHELAHILLDTNGITLKNEDYIDELTGPNKRIEWFCNQFAAEFLVPSPDFEKHISTAKYDDQEIARLANLYKVSREVILRKLLNYQLIDNTEYNNKKEKFDSDYAGTSGKGKSRGDYYRTQIAYLGEKYLGLAFRKYYQGGLSLEQLADYLNIKAHNISGLELHVLKKGLAR